VERYNDDGNNNDTVTTAKMGWQGQRNMRGLKNTSLKEHKRALSAAERIILKISSISGV
jgi:hypothetical protein